jgi:AcrR family transcriptional regulator
MQAALKLFAEKGFEHTSLDEIAVGSEFGKGTIYNYFSNKEEIYFEILRHSNDVYVEIFESVYNKTTNFKDFFLNFTKRIFEYSLNNIQIFRIHARLRTRTDVETNSYCNNEEFLEVNQKLTDKLRQRIKRSIDDGEIISVNIDSLINAFKAITMPYILFLLGTKEAAEIDHNKEAEFIISIFFNGISSK